MTFFIPRGGPAEPLQGPDIMPERYAFGAAFNKAWQASDKASQRQRQIGAEEERIAELAAQKMAMPEWRSEWGNATGKMLDRAREDAKVNPEKWKDVDLTREGMEARVTENRAAELRDAQTLISTSANPVLSEIIGGLGAEIVDPVNVAMMPFGLGSGSLLRIAASEAALGAVGEATQLPARFRVAEELDQPAPSVIGSLAEGAVAGAVLGTAVDGITRGLRYWRNRNVIPETADPFTAEEAIRTVEDALSAGEAPEQAMARLDTLLLRPDQRVETTTEPPQNITENIPVAREPLIPQVNSAPQSASVPTITVLTNDDLPSIGVDAETFQFKAGGDAEGVTERLRDVPQWMPERSGVALVYEYEDGRRFIVDGHQRLALAKRRAAAGDDIELPVRILREADGITPAQARARAATKNIAEGTGTPLDAAKVLRDLGGDAASLGLPPNSALVRQGEGISRLSDDAFGMVVNERATEAHGALVGRLVDDPDLQADILALVTKLKPKNAFEAESIIRQANEAGASSQTQASLFGDEVVASSLYLERARVLDQAIKDLRQDRETFNVLMDRGDKITAAGNTLDPEANAKAVQDSGVLMQYVQRHANMKGPISDALRDAAERYKRTGKPGPAVKDFIEAVREGIARGDLDGDAGRAGRGDAEPVEAPRPDGDLEPSLFGPAPEPAPRAPEPVQTIVPGTDSIQTGDAQRLAAEAEARRLQSKIGRLNQARVEDDMSSLFAPEVRDMFDDVTGPEAQTFAENQVGQMRADLLDENLPAEARATFTAAVDEFDDLDTMAREFAACLTGVGNVRE